MYGLRIERDTRVYRCRVLNIYMRMENVAWSMEMPHHHHHHQVHHSLEKLTAQAI